MRHRRRYFANLADVGREGRRFYAFYKGFRACKAGGGAICPYPPGGEDYDEEMLRGGTAAKRKSCDDEKP